MDWSGSCLKTLNNTNFFFLDPLQILTTAFVIRFKSTAPNHCIASSKNASWSDAEDIGEHSCVFFLAQKSVLEASYEYSWLTEVTWDFFKTIFLVPFMNFECFGTVAVYGGALWFNLKDLHLCLEDEWRSQGIGMTIGWVINNRIVISNTVHFHSIILITQMPMWTNQFHQQLFTKHCWICLLLNDLPFMI